MKMEGTAGIGRVTLMSENGGFEGVALLGESGSAGGELVMKSGLTRPHLTVRLGTWQLPLPNSHHQPLPRDRCDHGTCVYCSRGKRWCALH